MRCAFQPTNLHVPDPNAPLRYESLIEQPRRHRRLSARVGRQRRTRCVQSARLRVWRADPHRRARGGHPQRQPRLRFRSFAICRKCRASASASARPRSRRTRARPFWCCSATAKTTAMRRVTGASRYDPDWPASVVLECADTQIVADSGRRREVATERRRGGRPYDLVANFSRSSGESSPSSLLVSAHSAFQNA